MFPTWCHISVDLTNCTVYVTTVIFNKQQFYNERILIIIEKLSMKYNPWTSLTVLSIVTEYNRFFSVFIHFVIRVPCSFEKTDPILENVRMGLNIIQNRDGVGLKERNSISLFSFRVTSAFCEKFISMYSVDLDDTRRQESSHWFHSCFFIW